jgi:hypothetical protein
MFGITSYPFNFSNRRGIPMIESTNVTADTAAVTITLPNRAFRWLNDKGIMLFRLNQAVPESGETLPIIFSSNEFTQPLTNLGGTAITGTEMSDTGVYLIYYDKNANLMQLMTAAV